ncbi:2-isopropylmalate synthase [Clostridium sp. 'White wine YQ']|uniref:2-isopropylmalate synthase n=1 Tax=Clostridium sp. 'White wine YQ' TaxID=3027474 RepID=UPI0023668F36|nr:2-isopropylmalate synthase [Clostridium sp. 'White wine YQ']MDD7793119.1 2-isopropylmalate synthase [Clostridium sp. 'White wine YQ']
MKKEGFKKYKQYKNVELKERKWPSKLIDKAPIWCSVDLRDGNQALRNPMSLEKKIEFFNLLVKMGYKEIEVGFPAASQIEYDFTRYLIENNLIPDDVTIQILTQARRELIEKSFEALKGIKKAVVHLYNSTSVVQRKVVFNKGKKEIIDLAVEGTRIIKELVREYPETEFILEYSPESFSGTELDYALDICEAVVDEWKPTTENKIILNLPTTVEMYTPNVYADQIEWFSDNIKDRDKIILSAHPHNDRGTAVATAELAMLAGIDRIEGTIFGNGERTGNVDLVTLGLNLYTQGIDPEIDFSCIDEVIGVYEECTEMPVPDRQPYAGSLVYTAYSGSHQDAIKKGLGVYSEEDYWEVPYLPIDPKDVGRNYEAIIRINAQSGKGGIAFIMQNYYGFSIPKFMQKDFSLVIQSIADESVKEVNSEVIYDAFKKSYLNIDSPISLESIEINSKEVSKKDIEILASINYKAKLMNIAGVGNGPIDAFVKGLNNIIDGFKVSSYNQHSLGDDSNAESVAYIQIIDKDGRKHYGVGTDNNIILASIKAVISAVNKSIV